MKYLVIIIALLFYRSSICKGQSIDTLHITDTSFSYSFLSNGIYLENKDLFLPWEINFTQLNKYGNPKIIRHPDFKNQVRIKWDSVMIFEGILINLFIGKPKNIFNKNFNCATGPIHGTIDSIGMEKIKLYLAKYSHRPGGFVNKKKRTYFYWDINQFRIEVGYNKYYGYHFYSFKRH